MGHGLVRWFRVPLCLEGQRKGPSTSGRPQWPVARGGVCPSPPEKILLGDLVAPWSRESLGWGGHFLVSFLFQYPPSSCSPPLLSLVSSSLPTCPLSSPLWGQALCHALDSVNNRSCNLTSPFPSDRLSFRWKEINPFAEHRQPVGHCTCPPEPPLAQSWQLSSLGPWTDEVTAEASGWQPEEGERILKLLKQRCPPPLPTLPSKRKVKASGSTWACTRAGFGGSSPLRLL